MSNFDIAKEKLQEEFDRHFRGLIRLKTFSPLTAPPGEVDRVLVTAETPTGAKASYLFTIDHRGNVVAGYRLEKLLW